jgi:hypothetical protein
VALSGRVSLARLDAVELHAADVAVEGLLQRLPRRRQEAGLAEVFGPAAAAGNGCRIAAELLLELGLNPAELLL